MADKKVKVKEVESPLKNEVVKIELIRRPTDWIQDINHEASGLHNNSKQEFVALLGPNNKIMSPLTPEETEFFENSEYSHIHGFNYKRGDLAPSQPDDKNVWLTETGDFTLQLSKDPKMLDLSKGVDYILYKIALQNNKRIAPSLDAGTPGHPSFKKSYKFMIVNPKEREEKASAEIDKMSEAYTEFGAIRHSKSTLRAVLELSGEVKRGTVKGNSNINLLKEKVSEFVKENPDKFLEIAQDKLLAKKAFIFEAIDANVIKFRNNQYTINNGEDLIGTDLTKAAEYLNNPSNNEVYVELNKQIKASE